MSAGVYRRFLPFLRPYRSWLAATLAATLARPALNTAKVWLLKIVIDDVIGRRQMGLLLYVCLAYVAVALLKGVASFSDDYLGGFVGTRVVRDLRTAVYDHLQGLSLRFFHTQRLGDLLTRLTGDVGAIEDLLVSGITDLLAHSLTIIFFLGMLFYLDRSLAVVALALTPALAVASADFARRTRCIQQRLRECSSALTSVAEEGLSAIALVKAFARESFEHDRFSQAAEGSFAARLRSIRLNALFTPTVDLLATGGTVLAIWFGVGAVLAGRLSVGGLVVFLGYLGSLYAPIQALSRLTGVIQRARVGAERVAELLDAPLDVRERVSSPRLQVSQGLVEFRDVCFAYSPGQPVLNGVNLIIRPGELVALVGPSGAGKTTIISLLLSYYDAGEGALTIDGQDVRDVAPASVRAQIAAVLQEPMLFQASIRDNIRYGRLEANDAAVEAAACAAQADVFIRQLPDGYDTMVGPRGAGLSGGQRQRLALARALLKNAPIVVLDEATSALDSVTEMEVTRALRPRMSGRSVLVVAHRLSTIRNADRIVVLDHGQVAGMGTHGELMQRQGLYRQLYGAQAQTDLSDIPSPAAGRPAAVISR